MNNKIMFNKISCKSENELFRTVNCQVFFKNKGQTIKNIKLIFFVTLIKLLVLNKNFTLNY